MDKRKYLVSYDVQYHQDGLDSQKAVDDGLGATDAIVIIAQLYPKDGSCRQTIASLDGRTALDVNPDDMWKAWAGLAHALSQREGLDAGKKMMCRLVHETVTKAIGDDNG